MRQLRTSIPFAFLAALLFPANASAQILERDDHLRIGAHLGLGFGGEYDASTSSEAGTLELDDDLDPSVGFGFRIEQPFLDFFSVGGLFEAMSYEPDANGAEREWAFHFDLLVRIRAMFEVIRGQLFLEPYAAMPIGFTLGVLTVPGDDDDSAWPGWNIGALAGLTVITAARIGGFIELGWRHLDVFNGDDLPVVGDVDYAVTVNELALNLGAMFMFQ
ncbi:hypothetical protein [Sandaracinus amylolyticus]|uniref:Outer membrane protein beta-barrel domain-containing protein n=1 Tax=Sandaracinus amylolyticus TaxID=927083 RepID=A0A0F6W1U9_9BACT|nr:hypothetical protein [Sandaracinus amylolyticus]AKF05121.1 hypothetical protein DB32_002270 [Sandaracinus amylolyticus]